MSRLRSIPMLAPTGHRRRAPLVPVAALCAELASVPECLSACGLWGRIRSAAPALCLQIPCSSDSGRGGGTWARSPEHGSDPRCSKQRAPTRSVRADRAAVHATCLADTPVTLAHPLLWARTPVSTPHDRPYLQAPLQALGDMACARNSLRC